MPPSAGMRHTTIFAVVVFALMMAADLRVSAIKISPRDEVDTTIQIIGSGGGRRLLRGPTNPSIPRHPRPSSSSPPLKLPSSRGTPSVKVSMTVQAASIQDGTNMLDGVPQYVGFFDSWVRTEIRDVVLGDLSYGAWGQS